MELVCDEAEPGLATLPGLARPPGELDIMISGDIWGLTVGAEDGG